MNGFDKLRRRFTYSWDVGDDAFFAIVFGLGAAVAVLLFIFYNRSFEPAQFLVLSKRWESTTELVHDETSSEYVCGPRTGDCGLKTDTDTVVDASVTLSGHGLDPVVYHTGFSPKRDQYIRHRLSTNVQLDHEGTAVTYRPNQTVYEQLPLGGYCYGEIGWFNMVRRMRCGGR